MVRQSWQGYADGVDRDEILRVLRAFEAQGLEYVLIGATAMGFHGLVRAPLDRQDAEALRRRFELSEQ